MRVELSVKIWLEERLSHPKHYCGVFLRLWTLLHGVYFCLTPQSEFLRRCEK